MRQPTRANGSRWNKATARPLPLVASRGRRVRQAFLTGRRLSIEPLEDRSLLSVFTVTNANDSGDGSLRWAIGQANTSSGADTINFASSLAGQTITLTTGWLRLSDTTGTTTIAGLGANQLTISGNDTSGVLRVGGSAAIFGVTITHGRECVADEANDGVGGGIWNSGSLTVSNCILTGNSANYGGAIENDYGILMVVNCTISGNTGGGIDNFFGTVTIFNSTITGNSSRYDGGGICNSGMATIISSTVANNSSTRQGGGIWNSDYRILMLNNSIVANNSATVSSPDIAGTVTAKNCLIENTAGTVFDSGSGNNIVGADPMLGALADNGGPTPTMALLAGSPAIDAGSNSLIPSGITTDQRGFGRVFNNKVDIGAYEAIATNTAAIIVGPVSGLVTTEVGGTASFTVKLNTQPTANVTIGLSSNDTTEGTLSVTSLTFTSSNWNTTKTVTITGKDDSVADGNVGYTIVTSPADSTDPKYNRLNAIDVAVINVDNDAGSLDVNTASDVVDTNDGMTSLREAVAYANTHAGNDTITFDPLLAGSTITLTLGELALSDTTGTTTITGLGKESLTIVGRGETSLSPSPMFHFGIGVTVELSDMTIAYGNWMSNTPKGGAAVNNAGTLTMTGCKVTGSFDFNTDCGSVYNTGLLTMTDCTITRNGGNGVSNAGTATITNCSIESNSEAGIYNSAAMTIANCDISENSWGGVINTETLTITACTISGSLGNSSYSGYGGIGNSGALTVVDCTITGNSCGINTISSKSIATIINSTISQNSNRGIYTNSGILTLNNCTITSNYSSSSGGGISDYGSRKITLNNTIVADNTNKDSTSPDICGCVTANYCLIENTTGTTFSSASGNNITGVDPMLGALADNGGATQTLALLAGSSAIDAGNNALAVDGDGNALTADQREFARIVNGTVDIGAYELDNVPPTVTINQASGQADPTRSSPINFTVVFSETVTDFAAADVTLGGTAPGTLTAVVTGSGTTYNVAVSGMTGSGTVTAAIAAGVAHDDAGNANVASTSTDNSVSYDATPSAAVTTPASPQSGNVTITYALTDAESNTCSIQVEYSPDGGSSWYVATAGAGGNGTTGLASSPSGTSHTFVWASRSDIVSANNSNVKIRITPSDTATGNSATTNAFTVNNLKATLQVIADDRRKTYGAANSTLTYHYSGFVNGETEAVLTALPTISTTVTAATHAGTYTNAIVVSGASADNYDIEYVYGTFTVDKASLTITADNTSKVYGAAMPAFTCTVNGLVGSDTAVNVISAGPTFTSAATGGSHVGAYSITCVGAALTSFGDANYQVRYIGGTLAITQASLTITADNKTRLAGASNPTFTATYTGFVNSDTAASLTAQPVFSTTATADSLAGNYPIFVSGAASPDYVITFVYGTLTVLASRKNVLLMSDPLDASKQTLYVFGSAFNDVITIDAASGAGNVTVTMNGKSWGTFYVTGRIIARGYQGDDAITVSSTVSLPAWLYGDLNNDTLTGGGGANILIGGTQHDTIRGGAGRSLLIGSFGNDTLTGGTGETIMIGSFTNLGTNDEALTQVMKEWTSSASYATRVAHVTGTAGGLNGSWFLNRATVGDDRMKDTLTGTSTPSDLFFQGMGDTISGKKSSETLITLFS